MLSQVIVVASLAFEDRREALSFRNGISLSERERLALEDWRLSFSQQGKFSDWSSNICSKAVKQVFSRLFIISEMIKKTIVALISKQLWPIISKSFLHLTDLGKGREGRRWPCCGHGAPYWAPLWVCITSAACEDTGWLAVRFVHIQRQRGKVAEHPSTGRRWESPKCRCNIGGRKTPKKRGGENVRWDRNQRRRRLGAPQIFVVDFFFPPMFNNR